MWLKYGVGVELQGCRLLFRGCESSMASGKRILALRTHSKISHAELAKRFGTSAMSISRWDADARQPMAELIRFGLLSTRAIVGFFGEQAGLTLADVPHGVPKYLRWTRRASHSLLSALRAWGEDVRPGHLIQDVECVECGMPPGTEQLVEDAPPFRSKQTSSPFTSSRRPSEMYAHASVQIDIESGSGIVERLTN